MTLIIICVDCAVMSITFVYYNYRAQLAKNEDSMSWKVDQARSVFSSIVEECSELNVKFRKDIERLEGEK